jgi:hypothetical protein
MRFSMKKLSYVVALTIVAAAIGCSSSDNKAPSPPGSSGTSGTPGSSGAPDTSGDSGTPAATAPQAPKVNSIAKMMDALHVMWTNKETSCDTIDGERQAQMSDGSVMEKYKVVFSVPGDADNKHDTTATADMKYTYRLRCKKGTTYSDYSNEMSGNPLQ